MHVYLHDKIQILMSSFHNAHTDSSYIIAVCIVYVELNS